MKLRFFLLAFLLSGSLSAQDMPAASPRCKMTQKVGLGDISISYSRPNANGRKIFGTLVPYDSVWRTGANYPAFIQLSDTTFVEDNPTALLPGKYALYTIPKKDKWTIIISYDTALWGSYGYKAANDALRVEVPVKSTPYTETFGISFSQVNDDEAFVVLAWETIAVTFHLHVEIKNEVMATVEKGIREKPEWAVYWSGAQYSLKHKIDLERALEWSGKSVQLYPWYGNIWTQAELYAALGHYDRAVTTGEKALADGLSGENAPYFHYASIYRAEIDKWKAQIKY